MGYVTPHPRGHASAAVAITVSQSTGTVCIFKNGRMITELEKPRSGPLGRQL